MRVRVLSGRFVDLSESLEHVIDELLGRNVCVWVKKTLSGVGTDKGNTGIVRGRTDSTKLLQDFVAVALALDLRCTPRTCPSMRRSRLSKSSFTFGSVTRIGPRLQAVPIAITIPGIPF